MIQNLVVDPLSHVEEMVHQEKELKKMSDVPQPPDISCLYLDFNVQKDL